MTDESRIPTNLRTLLILEILGKSDRPMSPTEINTQLGLPKQTIHRLCNTLVSEGFLIYGENGKRLRPSRRLRHMASGILYSSRAHIARHQILEKLARSVSETVNFVVPEAEGMSYLDRVETDWPFRVQLPVGTHVPFHCTASGKVFLASLSPKNRKKVISSLNLESKTPNTISNSDDLLKELKAISKKGFAIDNEEFMEGMIAIAVPVFDDNKRFIAALAYHGPTMRLNSQGMIETEPVLREAADQLSRILMNE